MSRFVSVIQVYLGHKCLACTCAGKVLMGRGCGVFVRVDSLSILGALFCENMAGSLWRLPVAKACDFDFHNISECKCTVAYKGCTDPRVAWRIDSLIRAKMAPP